MCPVVCRLLAFIYTHQCGAVRWGQTHSRYFNIENGVKQGGVLSPLLFTLYIDKLLSDLSKSGSGCYIGNVFMGAFAYADDIVLLSPSYSGLKSLLKVCEHFSDMFDIVFNASKSKLMVFNGTAEDLCPIFMNNNRIPISEAEKHLGCYIGKDCNSKRTNQLICEMYSNLNRLLIDFSKCSVDIKYKLFKCFCMPLYGMSLIKFEGNDITGLFTTWRKCVRRLLNISPRTHCKFIHQIVSDAPIEHQLHKRLLKFIFMCTNNSLSKLCVRLAINGSQSTMCYNINYICNMHSVCKYDLLKSPVRMRSNYIECDDVSGAIKDFLIMRDHIRNPVDIININSILEYLCEI